jgi:4,5-DOPA dioxygenase extradiol
MLPSLFISHGAPSLVITPCPARDFLQHLGASLGQRPVGIVVISAHWETPVPYVNSVAVNDTIHDFGGFPAELYRLTYPAPGSSALAADVVALLAAQGIGCNTDHARGLDHGAWVPLTLIYPDHSIPVIQLSVQSQLGPSHHLALGKALAPLRETGILILSSGSFTHDLGSFRLSGGRIDAPEPAFVTAFADWFHQALAEGRENDLLDYRRLAPEAVRNHPTEEHLLPLFVSMGAAGGALKTRRLHASTSFGILRMDAYAFGG